MWPPLENSLGDVNTVEDAEHRVASFLTFEHPSTSAAPSQSAPDIKMVEITGVQQVANAHAVLM